MVSYVLGPLCGGILSALFAKLSLLVAERKESNETGGFDSRKMLDD